MADGGRIKYKMGLCPLRFILCLPLRLGIILTCIKQEWANKLNRKKKLPDKILRKDF